MSKVKILVLAANPRGTESLALDREIREIREKIQAAEFRDAFEILPYLAARPLDLLQALQQHKPDIVHFSGHGGGAGEILLVGDDDSAQPVGRDALVALFTGLKGPTRLVVLNACYTEPQARATAEVVGCAVGTNRDIGDDAAVVFASAFYQALAFDQSVQTAFDLARTALMLVGIPESATMELLTGAGCEAADLRFTGPPAGAGAGAVAVAGAAAAPARPTDRVELLKTIGGLYPSDFATLVAFIPGAARVLSKFLSVPEQASHLIAWAESGKGPGLDALARAYDSLD